MKLVKMQLYFNAEVAEVSDNQWRGASEAVVITVIYVCHCCVQSLHPAERAVDWHHKQAVPKLLPGAKSEGRWNH